MKKVKDNVTKIIAIISIALNVFQVVSKEAREWYVIAENKQSAPSGTMEFEKQQSKEEYVKMNVPHDDWRPKYDEPTKHIGAAK